MVTKFISGLKRIGSGFPGNLLGLARAGYKKIVIFAPVGVEIGNNLVKVDTDPDTEKNKLKFYMKLQTT